MSDITSNADDSQLAHAIVGMARSLRLTIVAEGVEEAQQLVQLAAYGCDQMQGYFFSPPVAADDFLQMLRAGRALDMASYAVVESASLA